MNRFSSLWREVTDRMAPLQHAAYECPCGVKVEITGTPTDITTYLRLVMRHTCQADTGGGATKN